MSPVRLEIRVRPGSARPGVGGAHAGRMLVAVHERAVDGKATQAALTALAGALGVPARRVRLVRGAASRDKLVEVDTDGADEEAALHRVVERLLAAG